MPSLRANSSAVYQRTNHIDMKLRASTLIASVALAFASSVSAQEFPLLAKMTFQHQDVSSFKNGVHKDKAQTLRITTKDLLDLVADAYGQTTFPFGARLVLVNYEYFQVQAFDGTILVTNTSPFLTYTDTYSQGRYLYQGTDDIISGAQKYNYYYQFTIRFDDPANDVEFTFQGTVLEKYSRSKADALGHRAYKGSMALTGSGSGTRGENFFILSGRITSPAMTWFN